MRTIAPVSFDSSSVCDWCHDPGSASPGALVFDSDTPCMKLLNWCTVTTVDCNSGLQCTTEDTDFFTCERCHDSMQLHDGHTVRVFGSSVTHVPDSFCLQVIHHEDMVNMFIVFFMHNPL